jgi:hypothetical protein
MHRPLASFRSRPMDGTSCEAMPVYERDMDACSTIARCRGGGLNTSLRIPAQLGASQNGCTHHSLAESVLMVGGYFGPGHAYFAWKRMD